MGVGRRGLVESRRGALAKSDITHGKARVGTGAGLDPKTLGQHRNHRGPKLTSAAGVLQTLADSQRSHTGTATDVRDSVPPRQRLWIVSLLLAARLSSARRVLSSSSAVSPSGRILSATLLRPLRGTKRALGHMKARQSMTAALNLAGNKPARWTPAAATLERS